MKSLVKGAALLSLTVLAACSPIQGNSLLTDQKDDPSTHAVDKTPKSEELFLKVDTPQITATAGQTKADISGECYVSTYANHRIYLMNGGSALTIIDLNTGSNTATCKNGRFNFAFNLDSIASGSYGLKVIIYAYDSAGTLVVNEVQGASSLTLIKP
ncbi:MAG: hypothetical protein OM95_06430 [Bdellovibrio sp. ArHS]|uniref:hypothetical protein n=1 Tax=Bdellovibrio sp. ArHS TaxID=1569284 RepID=UPI000583622D|nr:hypothetical protein [Bdellovibrio sp. ArHS]KHD88766.1 MAG: hypothetical protein OM95_06430 [Bdellovibrio sp. ArHS]